MSKGNQTITFTSTAPGSGHGRRGHLHPDRHRHLGPDGGHHRRRLELGGCSITAGGVVSFQAAGTCIVDANQAGNGNYNAAPQVQQTFTVARTTRRSPSPPPHRARPRVGGATYTPTATATSGLAVTITVDGSSAGICSITVAAW